LNHDRTAAHLADMLAFCQELRQLVPPDLPLDHFTRQRVLCLAVEKLFINLGEAAARLGDDAARFTAIPWRRVIGLRNILAHGYEQVAHEILYLTILQELPALEVELMAALKSLTAP